MKKHILVVSQYFYPEPFRINDMCKEWVKRGYKVTVVTGIPNYPEGKFYKGYGWCKKRKETIDGVDVIRLPIFARKKGGALRLALNYYSFVISGFFWKLFTRIKADLVFTFEVSPMTQALVGVWYAKKRKIPHYLYVQDLWPENLEIVAGIKNKFFLNKMEKMTRKIYRKSDRIFATSESFVKAIQTRLNENKDKVSCWYQYAEEFYKPSNAPAYNEIPQSKTFKIIFTGNIGKAQGLEILPKTAELLKEEGVQAQFVIVGDGRDKNQLVEDIEKRGVQEYFTLLGRRPAEEIPALLGACDAAFISFMNNELFASTIPAKLQSYMSCGMPIIASATGETERIIREANCGLCAEIGNAEALAKAVKEMIVRTDLKTLGENAEKYSNEHFNKKRLMDQMDEYLGV